MKITQEELNKKIELHGKWLRREEGGVRLELPGYVFRGLNIRRSNLAEANLRGADLTGANLEWATLARATLAWANLTGANLAWADLTRANLEGADLTGANLEGATLEWATLTWANLRDANLTDATLTGANLEQCKGIIWADCSFSSHGEKGRRLLAVLIDQKIKYFCGCFKGDEKDLLEYINREGDEKYKKSRLLAFKFVKERIEEVDSVQ